MFSDLEHRRTAPGRVRTAARPADDPRARRDRFVEAARELAREAAHQTWTASFTVHQVVARAGGSLKSFYSCLRGKDDLLLALLAHDSRLGTTILRGHLDEHTDPVARLATYVRGLLGLAADPAAVGYAGVLVREHRRLAAHYPDELRAALAPLVDLLARELARAADAGLVRPGDPARDARLLFRVLLATVEEVVLAPDAVPVATRAEEIGDLCWWGLRGRGDGDGPRGDTSWR